MLQLNISVRWMLQAFVLLFLYYLANSVACFGFCVLPVCVYRYVCLYFHKDGDGVETPSKVRRRCSVIILSACY